MVLKNYFELNPGDFVLKMFCDGAEQSDLSFIVLSKLPKQNDYHVVTYCSFSQKYMKFLFNDNKLFIDISDKFEVL